MEERERETERQRGREREMREKRERERESPAESIQCYLYLHAFRTDPMILGNLTRRLILSLSVTIVYTSSSQGASF